MPTKGPEPKLLSAAALFLAVFIVYTPSLGSGFVNWDDGMYVYENRHLGQSWHELLRWAFTSFHASNYHPLTLLSLAADHGAFGLNPFAYHLTNVLLHCLNTVLVFFLCLALYRARGGDSPGRALRAGLFAALLFGLHPLRVESVAWISERKDVLSAAFFLISLLCYLRYSEKGAKGWYAWTLVSAALSMMSKPMAITLPVAMLLLDYFPLRRTRESGSTRTLLLEKAPFFLMAAAVSVATIMAQGEGGAIAGNAGVTERLAIAAWAYVFYLYKTFIPTGLAPLYPYPASLEPFSLRCLLPAVLLAVMTIAAFRAGRLYRAAWLYYLLTLLPVIGLIQVGQHAAADRYTYLPLAGPFVLAGAAMAVVLEGRAGPALKKLALPVAACIFIILGLLTVRQQAVWRDSVALWDHEIRLYPGGSAIAYYNRGTALQENGGHSRAIEDFNMAVLIEPAYVRAYVNRGFSFNATGEFERAVSDFTVALELDPGHARAYLNRGFSYLQAGENALAAKDLAEAVRLDPGNGFALYNLGVAYSRLSDIAQAKELFERAARSGYAGAKAADEGGQQ